MVLKKYLIFHLFFFLFALSSSLPQKPVNLSKHPIILVVSFDGFRSDYLSKGSVNTPSLDSLKKNGAYTFYMETTFPTVTFTNHQTIVTGLFAESHGVVHNIFYDPLHNKTLNGFEDDEGFWNYDERVLPIWLHNEMAGDGRVSGAYMWPGSSHPYGKNNDLFPTYYIPKYDTSVPWEERVETVISWMTNETNPANLVFLYFNEPDSKGHAFGPGSPEILAEIENVDKRVDHLVNKLEDVGIFDKINLIITSDHGMDTVTEERLIDLSSCVNDDLVAEMEGHTPIFQFKAKEGKLENLTDCLETLSYNHNFSMLTQRNLDRYPYRYHNSRRILDLTVLAYRQHGFEDFLDNIRQYNERYNLTADPKREYGVHGYLNLNSAMHTIFIAHGPNIRKYTIVPFMSNRDIVPLISHILEIPEPINNGTLEMVGEMITKPPPEASSERSTTEGGGNVVKISGYTFMNSIIVTMLIKLYFNNRN